MASKSDILVRFGADIGPLKKGVKLAGLSLDEVRGKVNQAAKAMTAFSAAFAAGAAAMVKSGIESSNEVRNLANLAGLATNEFHKYAIATKSVGIEQEKFSDILKDTQDKLGDFMQTGAGPMADFFENIAPKVGVTVEQFKRLNSRQALQLYVDSLEKANVSQKEMVFYMEAIASDSSALLPLLRNNGAEFERLADNAERAGQVLSDIDAEKVKQASNALANGRKASTAFTQQLAVQFAPVLTGVTNLINEQTDGYSNVQKAAEKTFKFTIKAAGFLGDSLRGIQVIIKGLELAFHAFRVVGLEVVGAISGALDFMANSAKATINGLIDGFNKLPGVDIDKLIIGESAATEKIKGWSESAVEAVKNTAKEMHELMMKPLPSDSLDAFVEAAQEAAMKAAEASARTKEEQMGLDIPMLEGDDVAEDPEVIRAREVNKAKADAYLGFLSKRKAAEENANEQLDKIDKKAMGTKISNVSGAFKMISGLMDSENKRLFQIGKIAAISSATVDGIKSAVSSYAAGAKIGGPILGAAYAGVSAAATGAQIAGLMSTSYGSGSSSTSTVSAASVPTASSTEAQTGSSINNKTLTLEGFDRSQFFSGDQVGTLIDILRDAQKDGYELVVA